METVKFAAGYRAFYGREFILYSIKSIYPYVEKIVVAISHIQLTPSLRRYNPDITAEFIRKFPDPDGKIDIIEGYWGTRCFWINAQGIKKIEAKHNNAILGYIREKYPQLNYLLVLDTDEIHTDESIAGLINAIRGYPEAAGFRMAYKVYWKGLHYIVEETAFGHLPIAIKITPYVKFVTIREIDEKEIVVLPKDVHYHHLSYAKSSKDIFKKMKTFGHAKEIRKNWYNNVWKMWDRNRYIENIHPLFDGSWWKKAVRVSDSEIPQILKIHPYFKYETVDEFEENMKGKTKDLDLWVP